MSNRQVLMSSHALKHLSMCLTQDPGGAVFFSTINRNPKSWLFAIVGAEYVLKLLPKGTHEHAKFIKPSELDTYARRANLHVDDIIGLTYNPLTKVYALGKDIDVNYMMVMKRDTSDR